MRVVCREAKAFDGGISKWDVSRVTGAAWINSKANKQDMFIGWSGSTSRRMCTVTPTAFSPQSKEKLKSAVDAYLKLSPEGDCSDCLEGPIGEWGVSSVTDMSAMFSDAQTFNGDI